jgi:zinc D-Ala-D-Ala carboxypeptidase
MDWDEITYFKKEEFDCQHTGNNNMQKEFVLMLDYLRNLYGKPLKITSGYRDVTHPIEAKKSKGGTHTQGIAADIYVDNSEDRRVIVALAITIGFKGIGIASNFIHLDTRKTTPVMWLYS